MWDNTLLLPKPSLKHLISIENWRKFSKDTKAFLLENNAKVYHNEAEYREAKEGNYKQVKENY